MSYPPPAAGPPGGAPMPGPPVTGEAYLGPPSNITAQRQPAGLAIASFVLALVGCCAGVVPMVMSWIAMSRARRGVGGGHGIAVAAFILSAFWLATTIVGSAIAYRLLAHRDGPGGPVTEVGYLPASDLLPGDCLDRPGRDPVLVHVVPCGLPHEAEVFFRMPASTNVPESELPALCAPEFRKYVGIAPDRSQLKLMAVTIDTSAFASTQFVACMVGQQDDAEIAGTLRNARR